MSSNLGRTVGLSRHKLLPALGSLLFASLTLLSLVWFSRTAIAATPTSPATRAESVVADEGAGPGLGFIKCLPPPEPADNYQELARDCFYKVLEERNDIYARKILNGYGYRYGGWTESPAERKFWNGDYAGSYAEYVNQDPSYSRDPDHQDAHKLDPHLPAALKCLRHNDVACALREQARDQDDGSLYLLMYGNLYAQARDWKYAYAKWRAAAAEGPTGYTAAAGGIGILPDHWNIAALEMIYYYRTRDPLYGHPQ